jgi:hypothetical protein
MIPLYTKTNKKMDLEKFLASSRQLNCSPNSFKESNFVFFAASLSTGPGGQPQNDREKVAAYITEGLKERRVLQENIGASALNEPITLDTHLKSLEKKDSQADAILVLISESEAAAKALTTRELVKIIIKHFHKGNSGKEIRLWEFLKKMPTKKRTDVMERLSIDFQNIEEDIRKAYDEFLSSPEAKRLFKNLKEKEKEKVRNGAIRNITNTTRESKLTFRIFANKFTTNSQPWEYVKLKKFNFKSEIENQIKKLPSETKKRKEKKRKAPSKLSLKTIKENGKSAGIKVRGSQISFIVDGDTSRAKRSFRFSLKRKRYQGLARDLQNATTSDAFKKRVYKHLADIVLTEKWKNSYGKNDKYAESNIALAKTVGRLEAKHTKATQQATTAKRKAAKDLSRAGRVRGVATEAVKRKMSAKQSKDYLEAIKADLPYKTKQEAERSHDMFWDRNKWQPKYGYSFVDKSPKNSNYAVVKHLEKKTDSKENYIKTVFALKVAKMFPKYKTTFNKKDLSVELREHGKKGVISPITVKPLIKKDGENFTSTRAVVSYVKPIIKDEYRKVVSNPEHLKAEIVAAVEQQNKDNIFRNNTPGNRGLIQLEKKKTEAGKEVRRHKVKSLDRSISVPYSKALDILADPKRIKSLEFNNLKNSKKYEAIFARLGFTPSQMPGVLAKAINSWSDVGNSVSGSQIFATLRAGKGRKMMYHKFKSLGKVEGALESRLDYIRFFSKTKDPKYKDVVGSGRYVDEDRGIDTTNEKAGRELLDFYEAMNDLMDALATEEFQEAKEETNSQRFRMDIDDLKKTDKKTSDVYYNFDELSTSSFLKNTTGTIRIGVSEDAFQQFKKLYSTIMESGHAPETSKILTALIRLQNTKELLTGGVIKRTTDSPEPGVTKLVLTKLPNYLLVDPKSFNKKQRSALKKIFTSLNKAKMGEDISDLSATLQADWGDIWFTNNVEEKQTIEATKKQVSHRGQVERSQAAFAPETLSRASALKKLTAIFQDTYDQLDRKENMQERTKKKTMIDAEDGEYSHFSSVFASRGPKALATNILNRQSVQINAEGKKVRLYDSAGRVIKKNFDAYLKYISYLGARRERTDAALKRRSQNADDLFDKSYEFRQDNKGVKAFMKAKTAESRKEAWKKLPGHERVEAVLSSTPFNYKEDEIIYIADLIITQNNKGGLVNDYIRFEMEDLFKVIETRTGKSFGKKMAKLYGEPLGATHHNWGDVERKIKAVDSYETLQAEYKDVMTEFSKLNKKKNRTDKDNETLDDLIRRRDLLRTFINGLSDVGHAMSQLGKKYSTIRGRASELGVTHDGLYDLDAGPNHDNKKDKAIAENLVRGAAALVEKESQLSESRTDRWIIDRILQELEDQGYPEEKMEEAKDAIFLAAGAKFEGSKIVAGGLAVAIPIGDNFGVIFGVTNEGIVLKVGAYAELVKTNKHELTAGASGGAIIGPSGIHPTALAGLQGSHALPGSAVDFTWVLGAILRSKTPQAAIGVGLRYNATRGIGMAKDEIYARQGISEIEAAGTEREKLRLIKKNPDFAQFSSGLYELDDEDLLILYEKNYKVAAELQSHKEGQAPTPITAVGIGLAFPPPSGFIGIKIKLFDYVVVKPRIGERERLAQMKLQVKLDKLTGLDSIRAGITHYEPIESADTALDENGKLKVFTNRVYSSLGSHRTADSRKRTAINLNDANIHAHLEDVEVNGRTFKAITIDLKQSQNADQQILIDHNDPNLHAIFDRKGGRIIIPGNTENIRLIRGRMRLPYLTTKGGASDREVLIISTRPRPNVHTLLQRSKDVMVRHYDAKNENPHTNWQIKPGGSNKGSDHLHHLSDFQSGKKAWSFGNFENRIGTRSADEARRIGRVAENGRKRKVDAAYDKPRKGWLKDVKTAFTDEVYQKFRAGQPDINDTDDVVALLTSNNEKLKKPNPLEVRQLVAAMRHLYFVNVWEKEGKSKLMKGFEQHNKAIKKAMIPWFTDKIAVLEINTKPPTTSDVSGKSKTYSQDQRGYAEYLIDILHREEWTKFTKRIDALGKKPNFKELKNFKTSSDLLFKTVTFRRNDKTPLLAHMPMIDIQAMSKKAGTATKLTKWTTDRLPKGLNKETVHNIRNVILETISPRPSTLDKKSLSSSLAVQLSAFEGTGYGISAENFEKIGAFYDKPQAKREALIDKLQEAKESGRMNAEQESLFTALEAFTAFAGQMRNLSTGKTPTATLEVNGRKAQAHFIKLPGGEILTAVPPEIATTSYGICTNFTMGGKEKFALLVPKTGVMQAGYAEQQQSANVKFANRSYSIMVGVEVGPGEEPEDNQDTGNAGEVDQGGAGENKPRPGGGGGASGGRNRGNNSD